MRELEGIVNSLLAQSILFKREIDLELTQRIVKKAVRNVNKPITIEDVVAKVCAYYNLDERIIQSKTRKKEVVLTRQIAMYLAKKLTDLSTAKIGKMIGNRDHATVLHSYKTIKDCVEVDKELRETIDKIEKEIKKRD